MRLSVERCGDVCRALWKALARGHARSGDASFIAGYLGNSAAFDEAVADFAQTYSDQTERDYGVFMEATESGRLKSSNVV